MSIVNLWTWIKTMYFTFTGLSKYHCSSFINEIRKFFLTPLYKGYIFNFGNDVIAIYVPSLKVKC